MEVCWHQDENSSLGSLFYTLHVYQSNGALWLTKQHLLNKTYLPIKQIDHYDFWQILVVVFSLCNACLHDYALRYEIKDQRIHHNILWYRPKKALNLKSEYVLVSVIVHLSQDNGKVVKLCWKEHSVLPST